MDIIEKLYFGEISPNYENFIDDPDYHNALAKTAEIEEKLSKTLIENDKSLFSEYLDAQSEMSGISKDENFRYGFILGAKLALGITNRID
jgi:hypothetical protein